MDIEQRNDFQLIRDIWIGTYPHPKDLQYRLSVLERLVMCSLVLVRGLSPNTWIKRPGQPKEKRTQCSELYVLIWFAVLISFLFLPRIAIIPLLTAWRLIEGFNYRLCIIFVDRYRSDWSLRSLNRSLILLLINYGEMALGFAVLYLYTSSVLLDKTPITTPWNAVYFSVVTITTLGDGRFVPAQTMGEFLVCAEAIMGLVFLALVVSMFIGGIRPIANHNSAADITRQSTRRGKQNNRRRKFK